MIKTLTDLRKQMKVIPKSPVKKGCGGGLHIVHHPNGSIYYYGRMTVQVEGESRRPEVQVGTNSKDFSLNEARDLWQRMKTWARDNNREPKDYKNEVISNKVVIPHTFGTAVRGFVNSKREGEDAIKTWHNYDRIFKQTIFPLLPPETPLDCLKESRGGRVKMDHVLVEISKGNRHELARRSRQLIKQAIEFATKKGWFPNEENAARPLSIERSKRKSVHHPCLNWNQIPNFLEEVSLNKCGTSTHTLLASKFLLLTALRTGALSRLEWDMIDEVNNLIVISGSTSGIKRTEENEHIPHKIPITSLMWQIIEKCKKLSSGERYLFLSNGLGKKVHADPEAPNRYFKNLGFKGKQTAHGWRRAFLTNGIDVLKEREVVIRRQMGHLPEGSVLKAYDGSELLDERYNFLVNWGDLLLKNGLEI